MKHNYQPFCGPEGRFYCSNSVCSLWPTPFSYIGMRVRILGVLKIVCCWANKTWLLPYACCCLHFYWLQCLCPVLLSLHSITHLQLTHLYDDGPSLDWNHYWKKRNVNCWSCQTVSCWTHYHCCCWSYQMRMTLTYCLTLTCKQRNYTIMTLD